ncbi:hypothetical protein WJX74_000426 [Apatococcus lobatus]|uniref:RHOMBOID-like protein n=1 Tax=Apatococcus lobatus TaxID=904363 RepID=A0AAW1R0K8_9CHLO
MPDIELALNSDAGTTVAEAHVPVPEGDARARFKAAVQRVERGRRVRRMSQVIDDEDTQPGDRLAAAVRMEADLATVSADLRPQLLRAIRKKKEGGFDSFADRTVTEIYITGSLAFHFLTPRKLGDHRRWVTWAVAVFVVVIFFYQAGLYVAYLAAGDQISRACLQEPRVTNAYGLYRWFVGGSGFCVDHTFSADYLIRWGALWLPRLRRQPWRLWSSLFVHQTVYHMATNMFLWLALAAYVEGTFGWWRLAILWLVAGTGGALMTASFDGACTANVGFSGCDFGLLGVYVVDLAENIRTSKHAVLRTVMTIVLLILLIAGSVTAPNVSQWAHLGGFLSGLFPSMVLLPRLGHAHVEAWIPLVGAIWTVAYFTSLFSYVFAYRAKGLDCGTPDG